jgi:outer membrane receptor protein involved in Fe transport
MASNNIAQGRRSGITKMSNRFSLALAIASALAPSMLISAPALSQDAARLEVPSQPLAEALRSLGSQTKTNILFDPAAVRNLQAPAVTDAATVEEALAKMLVGSGLTYRFVDGRTVTLIPADGSLATKTSAAVPGKSPSDRSHLAAAEKASSPAADHGQLTDRSDIAALEEVVVIVTVNKRAEDIQNVPASVSVVGGDELANMKAAGLADYAAYIPGLSVTSQGTPGQTAVSLRGVATVGPGAVVSTYIDDTPAGSSSNWARASFFTLDLFPYDLERVEVYKGPQGTLYGSSAMGGLLKYVTRNPSNTFEAMVGSDVFAIKGAEDPGWSGRAAVNLPVMQDTLAVRASAFNQATPGYIDNLVTGEKDENVVEQSGGRLDVLWTPGDDFSLRFAGMWQSIDSDDNAQMFQQIVSENPYRGRTVRDLSSAHILSQPFSRELANYSLTANWNIDWATFVSATSYSRTDITQINDVSGAYGPLIPVLTGAVVPAGLSLLTVDLGLDKWTQEFRLASPGGGQIEWLVGAFYTKEKSENLQLADATDTARNPVPGLDPLFEASVPTSYQEIAVFGNLTYRFTDNFDVTGGVRWARNEQDFRQISSGPLLPPTPPGGVPGESEESVVTYSVSPKYRFNEDVMAYIRVATGYRPGGPNAAVPGAKLSVGSDTLINYEVGLKSEFLKGRVLFDAAVYRIDWQDIQGAILVNGAGYLDNLGKATIRGAEMTTAFQPISALRIGVNASYNDAYIAEDNPAVFFVEGDTLPGVPKLTASATAVYSFNLTEDWSGGVGAGYRYVGSTLSGLQASGTAVLNDAYRVLDVNASISRGKLTARLLVRNVTDERAFLGSGFGLSMPEGITSAVLQPRTVGFSLDMKFN